MQCTAIINASQCLSLLNSRLGIEHTALNISAWAAKYDCPDTEEQQEGATKELGQNCLRLQNTALRTQRSDG